ncbi:MAG: class E sortase [Acidimicrobiia bacterium]|nr:class E sortase [Acidimicrobiia bacterium]
MVARILGAVGRTMIAAGILLLLFVAYQLWGTGVETRAAQQRHTATFDGLLEQAQQVRHSDPANDTEADPDAVVELPPMPEPEPGEPMARIRIPRLGVDYVVLSGVDIEIINEGPAHFPSTSLPGQPGNSAIAGHRTTFGAPFHRLDELDPGDVIEIITVQGEFTYEVIPQPAPGGGDDEDGAAPPVGHYIVDPYAFEILDDKGDNRVTLMACHPKYSAAQRIIVEAVLVDDPAPATERVATIDTAPVDLSGGLLTETPEGAMTPAVLWSALFGALVLVAWLIGRWWRRWPVYLLATPALAVVLFYSFQSISRLLPAGY